MEKTVKIILTCGHPDSGYQLAHATLIAAGLAQAQPSRRESFTSDEFQANLLKACDQDTEEGSTCQRQILPGKVWQDMAVDLFMGNMAHEPWGWADAGTVRLLDFWNDFDPQVGFVLVYSSPEYAVGKAFRNKPATPAEIDAVIASWTDCNSEILRFYNRHSNRCLLVNASAVIHAPAKFVDQCAETFGIRLELADGYQAGASHVSAIASSLAKALVANSDEAMALFRELESTADFDSGSISNGEAENCQALQEYSTLMSRLDHAVAVESRQQATIEQLSLERDEQAMLAGERQDLIRQLTHERDEHAKWHHENKKWAETLRAEKIQLEQQHVQLARARDEQTRLADKRYLQIQELTERLGTVQAALDARQSDPGPQQYRELMQENELLFLQLRQIQEELEHYFLQNQELVKRSQDDSALTAFAIKFWRRHQPAEIVIDMREEIDGDNWYYAEHDGRWAGPQALSTIRLPALRDGQYELQLDIVDAMEREIIAGMAVSLNGIPLEIKPEGEGVIALIRSRFATSAITKSPVWEFQLQFHKLISPAQRGSDDLRNLAVRLKTLKLSSIG